MSNIDLTALRDDLEREGADILEELGASKDQARAALTAMLADAEAAIAAGDLEHADALRAEIPVILERELVEIRGMSRHRALGIGSRVLGALVSLLTRARAAGPVVLLLLLTAGCWAHRGTVRSDAIDGMVANLCDVVATCVEEGLRPATVADCGEDGLVGRLQVDKRITGEELAAGVLSICGPVEACVAAWPDLPAHRGRSYVRWCDLLGSTAASSL